MVRFEKGKNKQARKHSVLRAFDLFCITTGGELGIRTPGPVTDNSFQDCRNRPLCQLSICESKAMNLFLQIFFKFYAIKNPNL